MTLSDLFEHLKGLRPSPSDWQDIRFDLLGYSDIGLDWDGEGAAPPTTEAMVAAVRLATALREAGFPAPVRTYPTYSEGVRFEWYFDYEPGRTDYTFVEVEVESDGAVKVFIYDGKTQRHDVLEGL